MSPTRTQLFFGKSLLSLLMLSMVLTSCQQEQPSFIPPGETLAFYRDTAFWQEYHEAYVIGSTPIDNDVRSIVVDTQGNVWIATELGVFVKESNERRWENAIPEKDQGPSFDVEIDDDAAVWMTTWNAVYRFANNKLEHVPGPEAPLSALCKSREGIYAAGPRGIWLYSGNNWTKTGYKIARSIRDIRSDFQGGLWVGTDVGLYHCAPGGTKYFTGRDKLPSAYIRSVEMDGDSLWVGGLGGVTILNNEERINTLLPKDGLPSIQVSCLRRSPDGDMWVGTDVGVVRYRQDGSHSLLLSRRWLMDDHVNDIAFDKKGNAWIATQAGVSAVKKKKMTLASKQDYFYDVLMRRHIREPWIAAHCRLPIAGDTTQWEPEDDDNDGEYTSNYLAMESLRMPGKRLGRHSVFSNNCKR
jgi:ligand-binding sensor domain-containing protein